MALWVPNDLINGNYVLFEFTDPCEFLLIPKYEGDFDSDGDVDGSDLGIFAGEFGRTNCIRESPCEADFDNDGDIDGSDLALFADDFGRNNCPSLPQ